MASISYTTSFTSPQLPYHTPSKPHTFRTFRVSASVSESEKPPLYAAAKPESVTLPVKKVPGGYGLPIIGPITDRLDYFYNQGKEEYFKSRVQKYQSTVFRTNMPPGPFIAKNPNVVVLLDGKSFPVLFDVSKVEKKNLFTGTFMPSTELTGGYRILSYLDPSEPSHEKLKNLLFFQLRSRASKVIPEFQSSYGELFEKLEAEIEKTGKSSFTEANDQAAFNFLARSLHGVDPTSAKLGSDGPKLVSKWVLFNLHPLLVLGLPKLLEELLIHTFSLPPALVKKDYARLYEFFYESSGFLLDEAEKNGISREEACHNFVFSTCFNSFGGMKFLFPNMMKSIGRAGAKIHTKLATEIRSVIRSNGGKIMMGSMEQMPLMKSVVYECLRIDPPVASQYGRAKRDLIIESHDAAFEVKEGEMIFGYQPFATRDPKIFDRPDEFVPDRFVGEGEQLLKHVLWSNGPENESPTVANKQCAGKDFVVLAARLLVVELFMRYDSFEIDVAKVPIGVSVTVTSLKRASF